MSQPLIVDLHLDLAWDALFWNRDLTLPAHAVREQEASDVPLMAEDFDTGLCSVTFPEMRRGSVGIMLSTIMSRIQTRLPGWRDGMRTQEQTMAVGRGHLAYYQAMARRGDIKPLRNLADLDEAVTCWQNPSPSSPIYHILSMESADPIADPDDVEFLVERRSARSRTGPFWRQHLYSWDRYRGWFEAAGQSALQSHAASRHDSRHHPYGRPGRQRIT